MAGPQERLDLDRLGIAGYLVALGVFVLLRGLAVEPWAFPAFDVYAYWTSGSGFSYAGAHQGTTGAYLYSPAFAELISPLTQLSWPVFAALWTALIAVPLAWLAGRHALWLIVLPPVFMTLACGQLDLLFAVVAIVGLRWPAVWALPILTKVTPGVGLVWFLVRREWRQLGWALGATLGIALVSALIDPVAWRGWFALLARMEFPQLGGGLWFLPIPLFIRLPIAAALVAWGAARGRPWVLPVGMCLALPTVWVNSPTILVALLPLAAAGARTPAGAWLRATGEPTPFDARREQLATWLRRVVV